MERPKPSRRRAARGVAMVAVLTAVIGLVVALPRVMAAAPLRAFAMRRAPSDLEAVGTPLAAEGTAPAQRSPAPAAASGSTTAAPSAAKAPTDAPYVVVGLGDSVPAASACDCTSFVTLVGQQAASARSRPADVHNLAVGGLTTTGLRQQLTEADTRNAVADADLVIVTIGANDFDPEALTDPGCQPSLPCYRQTLADQRVELAAVLARIDALTTNPGVVVMVTGYWNVFLDGEAAREQGGEYVSNSAAVTVAENAQIAQLAAARSDRYVDLYTPFKGRGGVDDTALLAADGDHPNEVGHRLIARKVLAAMPSM